MDFSLAFILGLLGTFYGLTLSIGKIVHLVGAETTGAADVAQGVSQGLTNALSGMAVAFSNSLVGILSAVILSFAHAIGEFGVVLMVGGNLPGKTRTASIALFDQVQSFDLAGANRTALLLLGFAFAVLACTAWLRARERA